MGTHVGELDASANAEFSLGFENDCGIVTRTARQHLGKACRARNDTNAMLVYQTNDLYGLKVCVWRDAKNYSFAEQRAKKTGVHSYT